MDFPSPQRRPTLAEMLGGSSQTQSATTSPPPSPKRRLTLQEMLKQSPLMGNTVSLPEAVESAQAATARKADGQAESVAPPTAVEVAPQPSPVLCVTPAHPVIQAPVEIPSALHAGRYNLYARIDGRWSWQCDICAETHADAMRQAAAWLKPEHEGYPIRLEQDEVIRIKAIA